MTNYLNVIITLGRECRDWGNMKADLAVKQLIEDNARDDDVVVYTDGSVIVVRSPAGVSWLMRMVGLLQSEVGHTGQLLLV